MHVITTLVKYQYNKHVIMTLTKYWYCYVISTATKYRHIHVISTVSIGTMYLVPVLTKYRYNMHAIFDPSYILVHACNIDSNQVSIRHARDIDPNKVLVQCDMHSSQVPAQRARYIRSLPRLSVHARNIFDPN